MATDAEAPAPTEVETAVESAAAAADSTEPNPIAAVQEQLEQALQKKTYNFFRDEQVIEYVNSDDVGNDPYKVLDIAPEDDTKAVEKQFRKLAPPVHPKSSTDERALAAFKKILRAFQILGDPKNRKIYDEAGMAGLDEEKLKDADLPEVMDVLQEGKNTSTEFMTPTLARVSTCGNQMYTVLGLDESKGRIHTPEDIMEGFRVTQDGLDLDFDNILVYSNALSKVVQAYTILSNPETRATYDKGELKVDSRSDPEDPVGQNSLNRLLESEAGKMKDQGLRKRKTRMERELEELPPDMHNLYRSLRGEAIVPETPAPRSDSETKWYQDYRLFMVIGVIALYFWVSYHVHRMPEPELPSPIG